MSTSPSSPPTPVRKLDIASAMKLDILQSMNQPPRRESLSGKKVSPINFFQKDKGPVESFDDDTSSTTGEDGSSLVHLGISRPTFESPSDNAHQLGISMPKYETHRIASIKAKETAWSPYTISPSGSYKELVSHSLDTETENEGINPYIAKQEKRSSCDIIFMQNEMRTSPKCVTALTLLRSDINEMDSLVDDSSMRSEENRDQPRPLGGSHNLYHKTLVSKDDTELSSRNVTALTLFHQSDDLDSLDDGSSTDSQEEIDQYLGPKPNPSGLRRWVRRLSSISKSKHRHASRIGIQPALYELPEGQIAQAPPSIIYGMEINISGRDTSESLNLQLEPSKRSTMMPLLKDSPEVGSTSSSSSVSDGAHYVEPTTPMVRLATHISQFDVIDDCSTRTGSTCTTTGGDADRVELLMPRFDLGENMEMPNPNAIECVLRPWQVDFLGSEGVTTCEQLLEAKESREAELVENMKEWRREHGMKSFRASQCALALYIWSRSCKSFLRKNVRAEENLEN